MDRLLVILVASALVFPGLPWAGPGWPAGGGDGPVAPGIGPDAAPGGASPHAAAAIRALTVGRFIENRGQLAKEGVQFYSTGAVSAYFTVTGVIYRVLKGGAGPGMLEAGVGSEPSPPGCDGFAVYRMDFLDANSVRPEGMSPLPHPSNFFIGSDPAGWRTGVRSYEEIFYGDLYDRIDLRFLGSGAGIKYEFIVRPGGDPSDIRLGFDGATPSVWGDAVLLDTPAGQVRDEGFTVFQDLETGRCNVEAQQVAQGNIVTYSVGRFVRTRPLVIDPLIYSTVLGGSWADYAMAVTVDRYNYAYVAGETLSPDFPTSPGAYANRSKGESGQPTFDLIVAKLSVNGTFLVFSTYIGSSEDDYVHAIRVDGAGYVYLAGNTLEMDFPATNNSFDPTFNGLTDAFLLKLSPSGSRIAYCTFIGGEYDEHGYALALGPDGSMYVAGSTRSMDLPTTRDAFQPYIRTGAEYEDAFALRLSSNGTEPEYCTYLGGGGNDYILAMEVDAAGNAYFTGATNSADFPTTNGSYDRDLNKQDAFAAKLDAAGSSLVYSTFIGGNDDETGTAIALSANGSACVAGDTVSYLFPTTRGAFDAEYSGYTDCFIAKLRPDGGGLLASSFLGGSWEDAAAGVQLDADGNVYLAGTTSSHDFPTTPAAEDRRIAGSRDAFLAKLDPTLGNVLYSTYLGGSGNDSCGGLALDSQCHAFLAGTTASADFPGAANSTSGATAGNIFACKLGLVSVPSAPSIAVAPGDHYARVSWTVPSLGSESILSYLVRRGNDRDMLNASFQYGPGALAFDNRDLTNGIMYYYQVTALNASGEGERSGIAGTMPGFDPSAPRNLRAWPGPGRVRLDWQPPAELYDMPVLKYRIFRSMGGTGARMLCELSNSTAYQDNDVFNSQTYTYTVAAVNVIGEGPECDPVRATPSIVPSAPANLTIYLNGREATLSWDTPVNPGGSPIVGYRVYRSQDDTQLRYRGETPVRLYAERNLSAGAFTYQVAANSTYGEGFLSSEVSIRIINIPPVASYTVDRLEGASTEPFRFTSTSFDQDVAITNYTWLFGDGRSAYKQDPEHYYLRRGLYNITLRVRDSDGATAVAIGMVSVLNTPPKIGHISPSGDIRVTEGSRLNFSMVPLDPDADVLEVTWYLNGTPAGNGSGLQLRFGERGRFAVRVVVGDGEEYASQSWNVTVVLRPPPEKPAFPAALAAAAITLAALGCGMVLLRHRGGAPGTGAPPPGGSAAEGRKKRAGPGARRRRRKARRDARKARGAGWASQKHIIRKRYS